MAKLTITACAALFLLTAIVANPLNRKQSKNVAKQRKLTMEDIINQLKHCKEKLSENTLSFFVPKVITIAKEKNRTIEKLACRGVKALNFSNPDGHIVSLNRSLALFSKGVECNENSVELYDLQSFLNELLSEFQKHYIKHFA